jgi:hypothetical protein
MRTEEGWGGVLELTEPGTIPNAGLGMSALDAARETAPRFDHIAFIFRPSGEMQCEWNHTGSTPTTLDRLEIMEWGLEWFREQLGHPVR